MLGLGGGKSRIWLIAVICIIIIVVGAVAVFLIPGGPFSSVSEGTSSYTLEVKAIHSSTGEPLADVTATVADVTATVADVTATVENKTAMTGSNGIATFNVPAGRYQITLQKDGYLSKQYTVDITGDNLVQLDLENTA